jgi:hypothetical protein
MAAKFEPIDPSKFAHSTLRLANAVDSRITSIHSDIVPLQPEGGQTSGTPREPLFAILIPPKIFEHVKQQNAKAPAQWIRKKVKLSILWAAGGNSIEIFELRHFFKDTNDTALISIEGFEEKGPSGKEPKNVGYHKKYLKLLLDKLKADHTVDFSMLDFTYSFLSGFSTGYGGMAQTVNNDFIPLEDIERYIFYDCLYRADTPPLPKGEKAPKPLPQEDNTGADEVDGAHGNSAFNSRRAIIRIQKAQDARRTTKLAEQQQIEKEKKDIENLPDSPDKVNKLKAVNEKLDAKIKEVAGANSLKVKSIAYTVTTAGSPKYKTVNATKYAYTVYVDILIDLRKDPETVALFNLTAARSLKALKDGGDITDIDIPSGFLQLITTLPARGDIASGTATKTGTRKTIVEWGQSHQGSVHWANASSQLNAAIALINRKPIFYPGYLGGNSGGLLHLGCLLEFAGEYLL